MPAAASIVGTILLFMSSRSGDEVSEVCELPLFLVQAAVCTIDERLTTVIYTQSSPVLGFLIQVVLRLMWSAREWKRPIAWTDIPIISLGCQWLPKCLSACIPTYHGFWQNLLCRGTYRRDSSIARFRSVHTSSVRRHLHYL